MNAGLITRLRDTAQMKTKFPEWLLLELEAAADALQAAEARVAKLEKDAAKDAARLDWLDAHGRQVPNIDGGTLGLHWGYTRASVRQGLRAAIDALAGPMGEIP